MQAYDAAGVNRLRFTFADQVLSLGLAADATFADIAEALSGLSRSIQLSPVAIDVTMVTPGSRPANLPVSLRQRRRRTAAVQ